MPPGSSSGRPDDGDGALGGANQLVVVGDVDAGDTAAFGERHDLSDCDTDARRHRSQQVEFELGGGDPRLVRNNGVEDPPAAVAAPSIASAVRPLNSYAIDNLRRPVGVLDR